MADAVLSPDGKYFVTLYCGSAEFDQRDGKWVAYTDRVARLWDAATGKQLAVLRGHQGRVRTAEFSPDSTRLVTASDDTTVRVWAIPGGKQLAVLAGHACRSVLGRFSRDGRQVLTISSGYQSSDILERQLPGAVGMGSRRNPSAQRFTAWALAFDLRLPDVQRAREIAGPCLAGGDRQAGRHDP